RALGHHGMESLVHRRNVLGGDASAEDLILEFVILLVAFGQRLQRTDDVGVLTRTAGLLLVLVVVVDGLRRRFAIADLGRADFQFALVLAADALAVHVEVKLAHAGDDRVAGLGIGGDVKRRVLAREAVQGLG